MEQTDLYAIGTELANTAGDLGVIADKLNDGLSARSLRLMEPHLRQGVVRICVVGITGSGKSTVINAAVGQRILPENPSVSSPIPVWIGYHAYPQPKIDVYETSSELTSPELCDYITALCEKRGEPHERVVKRAGLDRVYGHQIFCGLRQPTRDKVIQLAFGFQMHAEEAQALLKIAHKSALYPRVERDAAILFCLHRGMSIIDTQEMLSELNLPTLGGNSNRE